ncbi:hypothetical protein J5287_30560 (plasmid) [Rhizobium sp. K1/93]|nr:hypothetical protein [Rhizobium sp. L58/93]MBO9172058.1 hypothetical protein [Rhizobium sp. L245/93]QXZ88366.1 hypothetical protein J5287_30560 [Rhizobium sp. K1/93]QXZ94405.1 hypothetical protein J5280_31370 [Rhizobium sp. K15/93]QYA05827.1 hypothetical protein J5278_30550 [Rhizobium sp. B21/90]
MAYIRFLLSALATEHQCAVSPFVGVCAFQTSFCSSSEAAAIVRHVASGHLVEHRRQNIGDPANQLSQGVGNYTSAMDFR